MANDYPGEWLTIGEAAEKLGVSVSTINGYLENGMEFKVVDKTTKIQKKNVEIWGDPSRAFELQWAYQQIKGKKQTLIEKYEEILSLIQEKEKMFGGTYDDLYGSLKSEEIDKLDEAIDIWDWKQYCEMEEMILGKLESKKQR